MLNAIMSLLGYVPESLLIEECRNVALLEAEIKSQSLTIGDYHDGEKELKDKAARIHAAGMQMQSELETEIKRLKRETVVARSEAAGDEYARSLFEDVFPGIAIPDRLDTVMEKLHLFMTAQKREIEDVRAKCLSFIEFAENIKEILNHLRRMSGMPAAPLCYPYPQPLPEWMENRVPTLPVCEPSATISAHQ